MLIKKKASTTKNPNVTRDWKIIKYAVDSSFRTLSIKNLKGHGASASKPMIKKVSKRTADKPGKWGRMFQRKTFSTGFIKIDNTNDKEFQRWIQVLWVKFVVHGEPVGWNLLLRYLQTEVAAAHLVVQVILNLVFFVEAGFWQSGFRP